MMVKPAAMTPIAVIGANAATMARALMTDLPVPAVVNAAMAPAVRLMNAAWMTSA